MKLSANSCSNTHPTGWRLHCVNDAAPRHPALWRQPLLPVAQRKRLATKPMPHRAVLKVFIMLVLAFILLKLWSLACFNENRVLSLDDVRKPSRGLRGGAANASSARTQVAVTVAASPLTTVSKGLRGPVAALSPLSFQAMDTGLEDDRAIDPEDVHEGPVVLSGHMRMEVPDPQAFLSDTEAHNAVLESLSHILDIRSDFISLEASWSGSMLMMSSQEAARYLDTSVDIDYSVTLQPHHVVSPMSLTYIVNSQTAAQISSTIQEELTSVKGHDYVVKVLEHKIAL